MTDDLPLDECSPALTIAAGSASWSAYSGATMGTSLRRDIEHRPVFLDASGRRQRRLRVAGAILVAPAVGYVGLLLSAVLGGPTINSPFLPLPDPLAVVAAQHPKATPTSVRTSGPARPPAVDVASIQRPSGAGPTFPVARPIPVALTTSSVITAPTPASAPMSTPVATALPTQATGRPTSLPTQATGRPTSLPTQANAAKTAPGRPTSLPIPPRRPIKTP